MVPGETTKLLPTLYLPLIVQRLYSGLSTFSLLSHLHLLLSLLRQDVEGDESLLGKLAKILSSLIFNSDSLEEWGGDVVWLAARVVITSWPLTRTVLGNLKKRKFPPSKEVVFWFLKAVIAAKGGEEDVRRVVGEMEKEGLVGSCEVTELKLRLKHTYNSQKW